MKSRPSGLVRFFSVASLKIQSAGRHVAPLGQIILIPNQACVLIREAANINLISGSHWFNPTGA